MGMLWHTPGYMQTTTACDSSSRGTLKVLWLNLVYQWNFLGKLKLCLNDAKKFILLNIRGMHFLFQMVWNKEMLCCRYFSSLSSNLW